MHGSAHVAVPGETLSVSLIFDELPFLELLMLAGILLVLLFAAKKAVWTVLTLGTTNDKLTRGEMRGVFWSRLLILLLAGLLLATVVSALT